MAELFEAVPPPYNFCGCYSYPYYVKLKTDHLINKNNIVKRVEWRFWQVAGIWILTVIILFKK